MLREKLKEEKKVNNRKVNKLSDTNIIHSKLKRSKKKSSVKKDNNKYKFIITSKNVRTFTPPSNDIYSTKKKPKHKRQTINVLKKDIKECNKILRALEEHTRQIKDNLLIEYNKVMNENKMHEEYNKMLNNKAKELAEKIIEVTSSMQATHIEQITSLMQNFSMNLEKIFKPNTASNSIQKANNGNTKVDLKKSSKEGDYNELTNKNKTVSRNCIDLSTVKLKLKKKPQSTDNKPTEEHKSTILSKLIIKSNKVKYITLNTTPKAVEANISIRPKTVEPNIPIRPLVVPIQTLYDKSLNTDKDNRVNHYEKAFINCSDDISNKIFDDISTKVIKLPVVNADNFNKCKRVRGIHVDVNAIGAYIEEVFCGALDDREKFSKALQKPLNNDPLTILKQLQSKYFGQIVTPPILPLELYIAIESQRKINSIEALPEDNKQRKAIEEWSNIHNKCVFDTINDVLDYYRPYGLKGLPLPWSKKIKELTYKYGFANISEKILILVKSHVLALANCKIPLAELSDEKEVDKARKDKLEAVLYSEVIKTDDIWVDYELEQVQVSLDITDVILRILIEEVIVTLSKIECSRPLNKLHD